MKSFFKQLLYSLAIAIPAFFVFRNIFSLKILAGGDAPSFYMESLRGLITEPLSWTTRGNSFGGQNLIIWLAPLTILYGVLGSLFKLGNEVAVRLVFYIPSIILSIIGGYSFSRYLKFSKTTSFFAALFYVLNTYFIILIDGGQVGVAIAYSMFPFTLILLKKLFDTPTVNYFFTAIILLFVNGLADPRVALISIITLFLWAIVESIANKEFRSLRKLLLFFPLLLSWVGANLFWIYPLIKNGSTGAEIQSFNFTSLLSSLFIFQPHYPANQFGKINPPPFYFAVLPILVFSNLFNRERKKLLAILVFMFLSFAFITKGGNLPLGVWYDILISKIPFGNSFRDSSKFFIPLILFAGVLIGNSIEYLSQKFANNIVRKFALIISFVLILLLIYPSFFGRMNYILSNRSRGEDSSRIYQNIKDKNEFFRSVYFSEHLPDSFETSQKPVIDGKNLVNLMPFRSMNDSEEVFNFVNNPNFVSWFKLLGIKYLFLSGNPRDLYPSKEDARNWSDTTAIIAKTPGLTKLGWGTSFPAYEIKEPSPKTFVADKLVGVIGPESENIETQLTPSIYFEDEKFNPRLLEGKSPNSVKLFFNNKEQLDLTMSFVKPFFTSTSDATTREWAIYKQDEYLKAKYELLIRGIKYRDFDYGKGLSFSTIAGEKLEIPLAATASGEFVLGIRSQSTTDSSNLKLTFENTNNEVTSKKTDFGWHTFGPFKLDKGVHRVAIENTGGLQIVNTVVLIPKQSFSDAEKLSVVFVKHFGKISENQIKYQNLGAAELTPEGILKSKFTVPENGFWLISTDSYNPLWNIRKGVESFESVPVYAMINGFYFEPNWNDVHIEYKGQEYVRWGIYGSICSILLLALIYFWITSKDEND